MTLRGASRGIVVACSAAAATLASLAVEAQPIPAERLSPLAAPRVAAASSAVRRRCDRLQWLAEHEQWDAAAALALELAASDGAALAQVADDFYIPLSQALEATVIAWPRQGAEIYQRVVGLPAESRYAAATEIRDPALLRSVADDFPGAAAAYKALWMLGDLALERGDWRTARADWSRVRQVLKRAPAALAEKLASEGLDPPAAAARMALAAIRGAQLSDALLDIEVAAADGLDAANVEQLRRQLKQSRQWPPAQPPNPSWPTFAHDAVRTNRIELIKGPADYVAAWTAPLQTDDYDPADEEGRILAKLNLTRPPLVFPVATQELVGWQDATGLHVRSLDDGATLADAKGPAFPWPTTTDRDATRGRLSIKLPGYSATHDGSVLVAAPPVALAPGATSKKPTPLVGIEFGGGLRLRFRVAAAAGQSLVGPPLLSGDVVAMAIAESRGGSIRIGLVGFDREGGSEAWRTWLGAADTPAAGQALEYPQVGLAAVEGSVFVATNLGMVAAVRIADGRPLWLRTYQRALVRDEYGGVRYYAASPQTPLAIDNLFVAAPLDHDHVVAWDASSGQQQWAAALPSANARVLGCDDQFIYLASERPWALEAATGRVEPDWGGELWGGAGQGALAGDWLLWPTDGAVRIVDKRTCEPVGDSLELPEGGGANVIAVDGGRYVVVAGQRRLTVYRRKAPSAPDPTVPDAGSSTAHPAE